MGRLFLKNSQVFDRSFDVAVVCFPSSDVPPIGCQALGLQGGAGTDAPPRRPHIESAPDQCPQRCSPMIAPSTDLTWSCPHCESHTESATIHGDSFWRCTSCGFAYPLPDHQENLAELRPIDDDDSWTGKWGPIRSDRYHVVRALATGAQGRILLAHHRHLDQPCVIKIVTNADALWADLANARLRNEAHAGIRVNHVNVARVLDCDCVDQTWYFVMEYIRGDNLRRLLQQLHHLSPEQTTDAFVQASRGLAAIHRGDMVHRDIKPSNLMLSTDGVIKIMDLGLAKFCQRDPSMSITHAGQIVGTPFYMPPEQFNVSEHVDNRADIYALGATMYNLLTGCTPFEAADLREIAQKHRHDPVTWNDEQIKRIPRRLRHVVEQCLAKRPEHRFASADEIISELTGGRRPMREPLSIEKPATRGVAVLPFRNLSRQQEDAWIGDAIAEYLNSGLMACDRVHVADRAAVSKVLSIDSDETLSMMETQLSEAGRLVGVDVIVTGNYQCQGDDIRVVANMLDRDSGETTLIGRVQGKRTDLFDLEDQLVGMLVSTIQPESKQPDRADMQGGTANLQANEQYIHAQRAFAEGDYESAIKHAVNAQQLDTAYEEPISLEGACNARMGKYERAVECHHRQEKLARDREHIVGIATALSNLGATYYYKGEYAVAFEFLDRAAALSREIDSTHDTGKLYGNLGMVLSRLNKFKEAEAAFERAIDIAKQFNDLVAMVWPYNGMGSVLLKLQRLAEAREFHQRALRLAEEVGDRVMVGVSQMNLGRCACLQRNFDEARVWFNAALGTLERTSFWNGLTLVYEHMAEMYLQAGQPENALPAIQKRIELAQRHGNRRMEADAWEQKARALETLDNTAEALAALRKSVAIARQPAPYESLHRYLNDVDDTGRTH